MCVCRTWISKNITGRPTGPGAWGYCIVAICTTTYLCHYLTSLRIHVSGWQCYLATSHSLGHMYSEANTVTTDRIIERLEVWSASPENQHARRILERFLRLHAQDIALLRSFLRYATGSGHITWTTLMIEVSESEQWIAFQTCLGIISMPNIVADPNVEEVILLQLEAELRNQNWIFNDV